MIGSVVSTRRRLRLALSLLSLPKHRPTTESRNKQHPSSKLGTKACNSQATNSSNSTRSHKPSVHPLRPAHTRLRTLLSLSSLLLLHILNKPRSRRRRSGGVGCRRDRRGGWDVLGSLGRSDDVLRSSSGTRERVRGGLTESGEFGGSFRL